MEEWQGPMGGGEDGAEGQVEILILYYFQDDSIAEVWGGGD